MNHTSKCEAHSSIEQVSDSRAAGLSLNPNKNLINLLDRMFYVLGNVHVDGSCVTLDKSLNFCVPQCIHL